MKQISTAELIEFIEERSGFVVDVRPVDAYNGWALKGEAQGGHQIPPPSLTVNFFNLFI